MTFTGKFIYIYIYIYIHGFGAPVLECDFNKAARRLCWGRTSAWVFSCGFGGTFPGALMIASLEGYFSIWNTYYIYICI